MHKRTKMIHTALTRMGAFVLSAFILMPGPAEAVLLRSWDRKITNATQRFRVLAAFDNQAVLDRETQLVWHIAPRGQLRTWSGAFNSCYASIIGGRGGWRLPFMEELTSLLDRTQVSPPLPAGHPFDVSNLTRDVWAASTLPGTNQAFTQDMRNDGFLGNLPKGQEQNYWCVRGGHGAEGQ